MNYWNLLRASVGTHVRDADDVEWRKTDDGTWRQAARPWWNSGYHCGSFRLLTRYGPIKRVVR